MDDDFKAGAEELASVITGDDPSSPLGGTGEGPTGANLASPSETLGAMFTRWGYKVQPGFKFLVWFSFVASLVILLVYGLVATNLVEIYTHKQIHVQGSPQCIAEQTKDPNFVCNDKKSTGNDSVLAPVCVVAGLNVIVIAWLMFDWVRIWKWIRRGRDDEWLLNTRVIRLFRALKRKIEIPYEVAYPHAFHYASQVVKDCDETIWKVRWMTAVDTVWFFLMSGLMGQGNVYVLVFSAGFGCLFGLTGIRVEISRRRLHNKAADGTHEIGFLYGHGDLIAHWLAWAIPAICWCVQLGDLYEYSNPSWQYLTLFLIYNIFILVQEVFSLVFHFWHRSGKHTPDAESARVFTYREIWHVILWVAYAIMFAGVLPYILIIGTSDLYILN